jgi:hypothetical protein
MFLALLVILGVAFVVCVGIPAYWKYGAIREIERVRGEMPVHRQRGPQWLRGSIGNRLSEVLLDDVRTVDFSDSDVTDSTLAYLKRLPHLENLFLNRTVVTDAGLSHLSSLTGLTCLSLKATHISDAGLAHLAGLTKLEYLSLEHTEVTEMGLPNLQEFTQLQRLSLQTTQVSETGLARLSSLSRLHHVYVDESQVAKSRLIALQRALPNVTVVRLPPRPRGMR